MSAQQPPEEERFHSNVLELTAVVKDLISNAYHSGYKIVNPDVIEVGRCVLLGFDKVTLITGFVQRSHKHWGKIKRREKSFFLEEANSIFVGIPLANIDAFCQLFSLTAAPGKCVIPKEDEDLIWEFFHSLIKISIKFVHRERLPYSSREGGGMLSGYRREFLEEIDIITAAQEWGLNLDFPSQEK